MAVSAVLQRSTPSGESNKIIVLQLRKQFKKPFSQSSPIGKQFLSQNVVRQFFLLDGDFSMADTRLPA